MDIGPTVALMLVALVIVVALAHMSATIIAVVLGAFEAAKPKGHQTPTQKFEADADRLHRLTHPEDDDR